MALVKILFIAVFLTSILSVAEAKNVMPQDPFLALADPYHEGMAPIPIRQDGNMAFELRFQTQRSALDIMQDYQDHLEKENWEYKVASDPKMGFHSLEATIDGQTKKIMILPVSHKSNQSIVLVTSYQDNVMYESTYPDLIEGSDTLEGILSDAWYSRTVYLDDKRVATYVKDVSGSPRTVIQNSAVDLSAEGWQDMIGKEIELENPQTEHIMMLRKGNSHLILYAHRDEGETSLVAQIQQKLL